MYSTKRKVGRKKKEDGRRAFITARLSGVYAFFLKDTMKMMMLVMRKTIKARNKRITNTHPKKMESRNRSRQMIERAR